jgi:fructokinase
MTLNAPAPHDAQRGDQPLYGGIEAGGTKFICALGNADGEVLHDTRIATTDPSTTLARVLDYFHAAQQRRGRLKAFGIAAFGPLELRRDSPGYGCITTTPKPGWAHTDLVGTLGRAFDRPVGFDTDVNAAALAEGRWGDGRGLDSVAYVTVGTGVGGGIVHAGVPVHGLMHPEVGHIGVRRHPADGAFAGICPFHGDCLEGLACGPAIIKRTGHALDQAHSDDVIWDIEADYLGQLCAQLALMHSPQRILLGGGVMQQARLHALAHARMLHWLGGYLPQPELRAPSYVAPPGLGSAAGIRGALALAIDAAG